VYRVKQIRLTERHILSFISAQEDMAAVGELDQRDRPEVLRQNKDSSTEQRMKQLREYTSMPVFEGQ
jgi:hypothetical protein